MTLLEDARFKLAEMIEKQGWDAKEKVSIVSARDLSPEEAIGKPDRDDYPLLTGKEVMMEARIRDGVRPGVHRPSGTF